MNVSYGCLAVILVILLIYHSGLTEIALQCMIIFQPLMYVSCGCIAVMLFESARYLYNELVNFEPLQQPQGQVQQIPSPAG